MNNTVSRIDFVRKILSDGGPAVSQATLAQFMGVSRVTVNKWLNGRSVPTKTHSMFIAIAGYVGRRSPELLRASLNLETADDSLTTIANIVGGRPRAMLVFDILPHTWDDHHRSHEPLFYRRLAAFLAMLAVLMPEVTNALRTGERLRGAGGIEQ